MIEYNSDDLSGAYVGASPEMQCLFRSMDEGCAPAVSHFKMFCAPISQERDTYAPDSLVESTTHVTRLHLLRFVLHQL